MNVLKRINGGMIWNLLGSMSSYAITIDRLEGVFTVYAYLSSYSCKEEIDVRKGLFNGKGDQAYYEFIDKHFLRFGGVEPADDERHKMYLDDLIEIKKFIYEESVQGVRNDPDALDSDTLEDDMILVPTIQDMYDSEEDKEVQFRSLHILNSKEKHNLAYAECIQNRSSEEVLEIEVDFDRVVRIYNASISAVEGFRLGNDRCVEVNKNEWVGKIPFEYKFCCVDEAFAPSMNK